MDPRPSPFKVRAGLRMELVADDNLVDSPAAMAFDERGRLFVAELRDYPLSTVAGRPVGRIRLLEDGNQDGTFDTSTVFADNLNLPSSLACSRGGVFVTGANGLLFALDQDDDGVSDLQRPLLSFNFSTSPEHPDQLPRAMVWGPDRRIHLALPAQKAEVFKSTRPEEPPFKIWRGGLSFNPLTLGLRQEASAGATGITFDDAGRQFLCSPSSALAVGMLSAFELLRNPFGPSMPGSESLVLTEPESAPLDCLIYRGNRYSTNLQGNAFLADPRNGSIYMVAVRDGGIHPAAVTQQQQLLFPLVSSDDRTFRPMQLVVGPDDAIYVADLAREVYPGGKPMAPDSEAERRKGSGRIWRLVPMANATTTDIPADLTNAMSLAAGLGSSNSWVRATAARLLFERAPTNATLVLRSVLTRAKWSVARLEALRSLDAGGFASDKDLKIAMADNSLPVRAAAVEIAQTRVRNGQISDVLWASLNRLSSDPSPELRYRVALALGSIRFPSPRFHLSEIYAWDPGDAWTRRALLTASPENLAGLFIQLVSQSRVRTATGGQELLAQLAISIGLANRRGDVSDCLRALLDLDVDVTVAYPLIAAFSEGVRGRASRLPEADDRGYWLRIANTALSLAGSDGTVEVREEAVNVVGACVGQQYQADEILLLLFAPGLPEPMQIPMIRALAARGSDNDFEALTQRWHLWPAREQLVTLNVLLEYEGGVDALLRALADGRIPANALTSVHINLLRSSRRPDVRARAEQIFGTESPDRDELLARYIGALDLQGSAGRGRTLFTTQCSYCHQPDRAGLGPAPETMRHKSGLQLLAGLLDPSREITPHHETTILRLRDGRTVWGVAEEPNELVIYLQTDTGARRYLKSAVENISQPSWSLMPDNMGAGLTGQDIADLAASLLGASSGY